MIIFRVSDGLSVTALLSVSRPVSDNIAEGQQACQRQNGHWSAGLSVTELLRVSRPVRDRMVTGQQACQ